MCVESVLITIYSGIKDDCQVRRDTKLEQNFVNLLYIGCIRQLPNHKTMFV